MQEEFKTTGRIFAQPIVTREIESGTIGVVKKNRKYHIVTITHIDNDGIWYVEGTFNGPIDTNMLLKFVVVTKDGSYPITFNDSKKVIKQKLFNDRDIEVTVKPYKFKLGKTVCSCTECNAIFVASARQPYCEECCVKFATACIVEVKQVVSADLRRMVKTLSEHFDTVTDFENWFNKKNRWQ